MLSLKEFFKKIKIYRLLRWIYWKNFELLERIFGTNFTRIIWKHAKTEGYLASINHSHRRMLLEIIKKYNPQSVLEIGCSGGTNLYLIGKELPACKIFGTDINQRAVEVGKKLFGKQKMESNLLVADIEKQPFPDKNFDIVLTDAVLIYVGPDRIKRVVDEMKRLAKKAIIMVERHNDGDSASGKWYENICRRNYKKLFMGHKTIFTKIPSEIWGGDWGRDGCIIEVIL